MARVIKRYENRKLYDTEASAYVSLSDLARLIREGATVEVIDNASGQDLTAQTLTQIILEEGKRGRLALSTDVLHDLLRRSGQAVDSRLAQLRHGVDDLVQHSLDTFNQLVPGPSRGELRQLRTQLTNLEQLLGRLLDDPPANGDAPDSEESPASS